MKLIPIAMIVAAAFFCTKVLNRLDPTPTPLPTLGDVPSPERTASPSPTIEMPTGAPAANAVLPTGGPISGGVLNGKAKSLPKPDYPPAAKVVRASGTVMVQVTVDEKGSVVSATAVSGHPLLKQSAVDAAKKTIFEPTVLSGRAVKVSGVLTFNFTPE